MLGIVSLSALGYFISSNHSSSGSGGSATSVLERYVHPGRHVQNTSRVSSVIDIDGEMPITTFEGGA